MAYALADLLPGAIVLSGGSHLRAISREGSSRSPLAGELLATDDDIPLEMFEDMCREKLENQDAPLVINDGLPRTPAQYRILRSYCLDIAVLATLELSTGIASARLGSPRFECGSCGKPSRTQDQACHCGGSSYSRPEVDRVARHSNPPAVTAFHDPALVEMRLDASLPSGVLATELLARLRGSPR